MAVLLIADTHFGHKDVHKKFRPQFENVDHHDQYVKSRIIEGGGRRDTLYILGDVVIDRKAIHHLRDICAHYQYVRVVLGNHDSKERKTTPTVRELFDAGVEEVYGIRDYKHTWLSHCPIHPQEFRDRRLNIHGHIHERTVNWTTINAPDDRYFNVSCESIDFKPIDFSEIIARVEQFGVPAL